jgi:hypothetical protein
MDVVYLLLMLILGVLLLALIAGCRRLEQRRER